MELYLPNEGNYNVSRETFVSWNENRAYLGFFTAKGLFHVKQSFRGMENRAYLVF